MTSGHHDAAGRVPGGGEGPEIGFRLAEVIEATLSRQRRSSGGSSTEWSSASAVAAVQLARDRGPPIPS